MKKILLWMVGSMGVLVVLGYGAVLMFFPAERVRVYLEEAGSEALGQPLSIGALSVSLWGGVGVELENVLVGDSLNPPNLARINQVDVKLRFWSALFGDYEVDYVTLTKPELALVYAADGTTNFDLPDDIATSVPGVVFQPPVGTAPIDDETAVLFGGLSLGDLRVKDGTLTRRNELAQSELTVWGLQYNGDLKPLVNSAVHGMYSSAGELDIDSARLVTWDTETEIASAEIMGEQIAKTIRLPELGLTYNGEVNMTEPSIELKQAQISALGLVVDVTGELANLTTEPSVDFEYTVSGNDLAKIAESVQALAPDMALGLSALGGALTGRGTAQYLYGAKPRYLFDGSVNQLVFWPTGAPEALTAEILGFTVTENSLKVSVDPLVSGDSQMKFSVELENYDDPQVECAISGGASLAVLSAFLPQGGSPELAGEAEFDFLFSGPMNKPELMDISGEFVIANGSLRATTLPEQLERIDISLSVASDRIEIKRFDLDFESSDISLTGEINSPFPYLLPVADSIKWRYPSPYMTFESHSKRLDIDKLFPEAAPGSGVNRASLPPSELPPLPVPQVNGAGVARFDTLIYTDVEFTDVRTNVRLEKAQIYCDNVTGDVYNGTTRGNAVIDLTYFDKPVYYGKFNADSLDVGAVLERFLPFGSAGAFVGKIKLDGNYASSGWEPADFVKSLSMNLTSSGSSLQLRNSPLVKQAFDAITQYSGKSYAPERYETLDLKSFAGSVRLKDGKVVTDKLSAATGQLGDFVFDGAIGFDGKLDLKCDFTPNETIRSDLLGQSGFAGALGGLLGGGQAGGLSVPLEIGGTTEKPVITIGIDKILKERGSSLLKGLFQGR